MAGMGFVWAWSFDVGGSSFAFDITTERCVSEMPGHMIERLKCMEKVFHRPKAVDIPWTTHGEKPAGPGFTARI